MKIESKKMSSLIPFIITLKRTNWYVVYIVTTDSYRENQTYDYTGNQESGYLLLD